MPTNLACPDILRLLHRALIFDEDYSVHDPAGASRSMAPEVCAARPGALGWHVRTECVTQTGPKRTRSAVPPNVAITLRLGPDATLLSHSFGRRSSRPRSASVGRISLVQRRAGAMPKDVAADTTVPSEAYDQHQQGQSRLRDDDRRFDAGARYREMSNRWTPLQRDRIRQHRLAQRTRSLRGRKPIRLGPPMAHARRFSWRWELICDIRIGPRENSPTSAFRVSPRK